MQKDIESENADMDGVTTWP